MRSSLLATAAAAVLALAGAAQAEALTDKPLVDAEWLKSNLGNDKLVVIDIRDAVENVNPYASAHIPGAVSAPYAAAGWRTEVNGVPGMLPPVEQIEALIGGLGVDSDEHVVIVPNGTDSSEFGGATRVYWTFKALGHDAVSILDGGARAWEAAGGETTAEATQPQATEFTAEPNADYLATTEDVQKALEEGTALLDGRPVEQFKGESKSPVARVAGTIPGSVNIPHSNFYDAEKASFASPEKVAELAGAVGIEADEENIAFCNTGHWASIAWFALSEVQGNKNTKMYDGSMAEWTADPARPVEAGS